MNYVAVTIKYLLFVFNLLFSLCGLAFLVYGVVVHVNLENSLPEIQTTHSLLGIGIIVVGGITFVIAFFGWFGAIRENRRMLITFRIFMSLIVVVQIAFSAFIVVMYHNMREGEVKVGYRVILDKYWVDPYSQTLIDSFSPLLHCCGFKGPNDFMLIPKSTGKYPWSCCRDMFDLNFEACTAGEVYRYSCADAMMSLENFLSSGLDPILYGILLGIVGVEFIGIIFAFCLANSIRNVEKRSMEIQELLR